LLVILITKINEDEKTKVIGEIDRELKQKSKPLVTPEKVSLKEQRDKAVKDVRSFYLYQILSEADYREFSLKYGQIFEAGTGAETLRNIFKK